MLTRRIQIQLIVFVAITLVAVSYVGARYAGLGSLVHDDSYTVTGHFGQAGGIYEGAEVTYRGVKIGQVGPLTLTDDGVDVALDIDNSWKNRIPTDTRAVVANRSAVGEQFVELQPEQHGGPYLHDGSDIARSMTATPLPTEQLLGDLSHTVDSVDKKALSTTVSELGTAFAGTGPDLQQIVDTGTSFVNTANKNIDLTTDLIKDSNTVLKTQMKESKNVTALSSDLDLFTGTVSKHNPALIRLIDSGAAASSDLRVLLEENKVNLAQLIREVAKTGKIVSQRIDGINQLLVIYPTVVEAGYAVTAKDPGTGLYNEHFGMILTSQNPCTKGYEGTKKHSPLDTKSDMIHVNSKAHCEQPISQGDSRGAQNGPAKRAPVVASYDESTGKLTWGDQTGKTGQSEAPATYGDESWRWLYLGPLATGR